MLKKKLFLVVFILITMMSTLVYGTEGEITPETTSAEIPAETSAENPDAASTEETAAEQNVTEQDMFFSGDEITIEQLIDGNVFVIGKTVTFKGEIGGDLFVIAEKLNLESGAIYGNLFAMAGEVTINNQMYDAYISADKVVMNYDGYIYRDLRATTSEIELNGVVRRNAFIDANTVTLNADCIIQGNLNYTAKEELKLPEGVDDITTLVYQNVNFEKNNKNVYSKDISKTVTSLINKTKLDKDAEAEDLKNLIVGTVFDGLGINTNIDKYSSKTVTLPKVVFYGLIAAVVLLAVCVLVLVLTKKKSQNTEKPKKVKEEKIKEKIKEKVKEESPIKEEPKAKDENNDQEK